MSVQYDLPIVVFADAKDAIARGYDYKRPKYQDATITQAVIIKDGTLTHKPTVDFIFKDEAGQKHVVMLTGALIQTLARCL